MVKARLQSRAVTLRNTLTCTAGWSVTGAMRASARPSSGEWFNQQLPVAHRWCVCRKCASAAGLSASLAWIAWRLALTAGASLLLLLLFREYWNADKHSEGKGDGKHDDKGGDGKPDNGDGGKPGKSSSGSHKTYKHTGYKGSKKSSGRCKEALTATLPP
jgi:hypothetical protein